MVKPIRRRVVVRKASAPSPPSRKKSSSSINLGPSSREGLLLDLLADQLRRDTRPSVMVSSQETSSTSTSPDQGTPIAPTVKSKWVEFNLTDKWAQLILAIFLGIAIMVGIIFALALVALKFLGKI